jgi:hypothetical protein
VPDEAWLKPTEFTTLAPEAGAAQVVGTRPAASRRSLRSIRRGMETVLRSGQRASRTPSRRCSQTACRIDDLASLAGIRAVLEAAGESIAHARNHEADAGPRVMADRGQDAPGDGRRCIQPPIRGSRLFASPPFGRWLFLNTAFII